LLRGGDVRREVAITKPVPITARGVRYVSTFWWLLRNQWASGRWLFMGVMVSGLVQRLGEIIVMIATVKCISWLFKPHSIPNIVQTLIPLDPQGAGFHSLMLIIPASFVMVLTIGGLAFEKFQTVLITRCADRIATAELQARMQGLAQSGTAPPPDQAQLLVDGFNESRSKLLKIQRKFINLLVAGCALATAVLIGGVIQPMVTVLVALVGLLFVIFVIWNRHSKTPVLSAESKFRRQRHDERSAELKQMMLTAPLDETRQGAVLALVDTQHKDVLADHADDERHQRASRVVMDMAQAALILLLMGSLLFVPHEEVNTQQVAMLMILALIMRFAMSQIRNISRLALQLSDDYGKLVELRSKKPHFRHWSADASPIRTAAE